MRFFRKLRGNQLAPTGNVNLRIRTPLESHLWKLAQEHADRAEAASESDSTEMREAIGAIVMSAACLEAYVNAVLIEELRCSEEVLDRSLEGKWELAAETIGQPFDKGLQPFQDLNWLAGERNYILHYKPAWKEPVKTARGRASEASARLSREAARRAVQTCQALIIDLSEKRGEAPPRWFSG